VARVRFQPNAGVFQGFLPWVITKTRRGDGRHEIITSPLEGHEEYKAMQFILPSGPPTINMAMGLEKIETPLSFGNEFTLMTKEKDLNQCYLTDRPDRIAASIGHLTFYKTIIGCFYGVVSSVSYLNTSQELGDLLG